jgi:hypothetical protein
MTMWERKKMKDEKRRKHLAEYWAHKQAGETSRNREFVERAQQRSDSPLVCEYCGRRVVIQQSGRLRQR